MLKTRLAPGSVFAKGLLTFVVDKEGYVLSAITGTDVARNEALEFVACSKLFWITDEPRATAVFSRVLEPVLPLLPEPVVTTTTVVPAAGPEPIPLDPGEFTKSELTSALSKLGTSAKPQKTKAELWQMLGDLVLTVGMSAVCKALSDSTGDL